MSGKRLSPGARATLQRFATPFAALGDLPDDELRAILTAAKEPSQTNCWWLHYRVADLLITVIELVLKHREITAQSQPEAKDPAA